MEKAQFLQVLEAVVTGFEDPAFRAAMAEAQAAGDVGQLMQLPLGVQQRAFSAAGVDAATGAVAFKEAGKRFGGDADVAPLLVRMKAAL